MAELTGTGEDGSRVKRPACFLGANDEKLWKAVTCLLLRPDVFVAFVLTGILKQQWKGYEGGLRTMKELPPYVAMSLFICLKPGSHHVTLAGLKNSQRSS